MHIAKIQKLENKVILVFYDIDLNILEEESFTDISSLNFFLQTLPESMMLKELFLLFMTKDKIN